MEEKRLDTIDGKGVPEESTAPENKTQAQKQKSRKKNSLLRDLGSLLFRILFLLAAVYVLFFHIVGLTLMPNGDMAPRVDAGDLLLFYRLERTFKAQDIIVFQKPASALEVPAVEFFDDEEEFFEEEPEEELPEAVIPERPKTFTEKLSSAVNRFDRKVKSLMGRKLPAEDAGTLVCRVVAVAGDTVEISDDERLIVNGNAMIETGIFFSTPEYAGFVEYPLELQAGEVFVLADHRQGGADSRFFGPVKEEEILGTVITLLRRNKL